MKKQTYSEMSSVWQGSETKEYTAECVVPDVLPDVGQILDACGLLTLRSRDTRDGAIYLNAAADITVLYTTEEGDRVLSVNTVVPVELSMNAPGIDGSCRTTLQPEIVSVDARTVNSRKLAIRVCVKTEASCWRSNEKTVFCEGETVPEGVKLLCRKSEVQLVTDVREKTFIVSDRIPLPEGCEPSFRILSKSVSPILRDVKTVSGKTIFKGCIQTKLLLASAEGSGLCTCEFESDFSQITETEGEGADGVSEVFLSLTGAYFDMPESSLESPAINAELHFAAQVLCRHSTELSYVADAYSNRTALIPETVEENAVCAVSPLSVRKTASGIVEPYFAGGTVLSADAVITSVSAERNRVQGGVILHIITLDEKGRYSSAKCRTAVTFEPELNEASVLEHISVTVGDVYYSFGEKGTELRAEITLNAYTVTECRLSYVAELREDGELWNGEKGDIPSLTLVRCDTAPDYWSLAKRYHSDPDAIRALNDEKNVGLLLVPRTR